MNGRSTTAVAGTALPGAVGKVEMLRIGELANVPSIIRGSNMLNMLHQRFCPPFTHIHTVTESSIGVSRPSVSH